MPELVEIESISRRIDQLLINDQSQEAIMFLDDVAHVYFNSFYDDHESRTGHRRDSRDTESCDSLVDEDDASLVDENDSRQEEFDDDSGVPALITYDSDPKSVISDQASKNYWDMLPQDDDDKSEDSPHPDEEDDDDDCGTRYNFATSYFATRNDHDSEHCWVKLGCTNHMTGS